MNNKGLGGISKIPSILFLQWLVKEETRISLMWWKRKSFMQTARIGIVVIKVQRSRSSKKCQKQGKTGQGKKGRERRRGSKRGGAGEASFISAEQKVMNNNIRSQRDLSTAGGPDIPGNQAAPAQQLLQKLEKGSKNQFITRYFCWRWQVNPNFFIHHV